MEHRNPNTYTLDAAMLDANRAALQTARPWAWRRLVDGLPDAPRPEPVTRPGWPFNLALFEPGGRARCLHEPLDPAGEATALVARLPVERADALVVVGFGAGYVVEAALAAIPAGCRLIVAVVDPGSFGVTLGARDLAAVLADPRLLLAVGDAAELRAALPRHAARIAWAVHPPILLAAAPSLARFADARPGARPDSTSPRALPGAEDPHEPR